MPKVSGSDFMSQWFIGALTPWKRRTPASVTAPQSGTSHGLVLESGHALQLVGDAEQLRPLPALAAVQEREAAVVVAAADADAHAAVIECHERRQHEVEPARVDRFVGCGLEDAEEVALRGRLATSSARSASCLP